MGFETTVRPLGPKKYFGAKVLGLNSVMHCTIIDIRPWKNNIAQMRKECCLGIRERGRDGHTSSIFEARDEHGSVDGFADSLVDGRANVIGFSDGKTGRAIVVPHHDQGGHGGSTTTACHVDNSFGLEGKNICISPHG
eukprot:TRINITY_DN9695_c0_g1_i7.p3 TRINITY_DN9695_c0_g1~~TRINITY_DN9695_c0_g1_i7.p3  ORF type:complete len:138 (-),score=8.04 TRINITY_DN9695_c0_g1_i7:434-847(-)